MAPIPKKAKLSKLEPKTSPAPSVESVYISAALVILTINSGNPVTTPTIKPQRIADDNFDLCSQIFARYETANDKTQIAITIKLYKANKPVVDILDTHITYW